MMVCRVVAYRSLSIALGLAPTPSTRKRRDFQNHAFFVNNPIQWFPRKHTHVYNEMHVSNTRTVM